MKLLLSAIAFLVLAVPARAQDSITLPAAAAPAPSGDTVRARVAAKIAELLGVPGDALRLSFEETRSDLLNTPTLGRTVAVQAMGASDRLNLSVRVYAGDRLIASGPVR